MEDKEDKKELMNKEEELMSSLMPQGTLHCSCLEHCFLFASMKRTFGSHFLPSNAWDTDGKVVQCESTCKFDSEMQMKNRTLVLQFQD